MLPHINHCWQCSELNLLSLPVQLSGEVVIFFHTFCTLLYMLPNGLFSTYLHIIFLKLSVNNCFFSVNLNFWISLIDLIELSKLFHSLTARKWNEMNKYRKRSSSMHAKKINNCVTRVRRLKRRFAKTSHWRQAMKRLPLLWKFLFCFHGCNISIRKRLLFNRFWPRRARFAEN